VNDHQCGNITKWGKKKRWLDYKKLDKWQTLNSNNKLNVALGLTQL
jgi:hypothetical protein